MRRFVAHTAALVFAVIVTSAGYAQVDLREPAGKEWITVGGDWHNTRYSTLAQIDRNNDRHENAHRHLGAEVNLGLTSQCGPT
jgi:hypothetical protein